MKWKIIIYNKRGKPRAIPLNHDYNTEEEASREAEDIADREFTENDEDWTLNKEMEFKKIKQIE